MAERLIDTSMLTAEADAIRGKGVSGNIEFKNNGFADAINSITIPKNVQYCAKSKRITDTSYVSTGVSITVAKTARYNVKWFHVASSTGSSSNDYSTRLYVGNTAKGSVHYAPATNSTTEDAHIAIENNLQLTAGQVLEIRARQYGSYYSYILAGMLVIEEV